VDTDEAAIGRMLAGRRIAVVGISEDPSQPSHYVSFYMQRAGYTIFPVNPKYQTVVGETCYATLGDVPGPIDVVNVFRRPLACAQVVRDAIAIGAKGVWLQSGIANDEAKQLAAAAGIDFVQDRCIMVERARRR
jgi:predicted CoA-binding protein